MLGKNALISIRIEGYKSIKKCEVELKKRNILIGSNGAGKSNFISAFSLLQEILLKNLQVFVGQSGSNSFFYNGLKVTERIVFEVSFGNNSYGFTLIPTDDGSLIFQEEHFGYRGGWSHDKTIAGYTEKTETATLARGNRESKWNEGVHNIYDKYVIPALEKQNWRVYHFHDTSRNAGVKQVHNLSNNQVLRNDAGNLAAFLYRLKHYYSDSYNDIVTAVRLIAPYFSDFILNPEDGNGELITLRWQQRGCEDIFNASQLSDGTLRFMCLSTLLLQPRELQPTTIVVDEPELGLHPYAISLFAEMVNHLPEDKQIIISTQSPELLNEFDVEDIIVVERGSEGTEFKRLSSEELEIWLREDYALGDLWMKNVFGGRLSR